MSSAQVHNLRSLQANLNAAIDVFVKKVEESQDKEIQSSNAGMDVSEAANRIVEAFKNPIQELLELGFQVGLRANSPLNQTPLILFQGTQLLAMRIAVDLDLFNPIQERMTLKELVEKTGAERLLLCKPVTLHAW
jgi:hypothetical protein